MDELLNRQIFVYIRNENNYLIQSVNIEKSINRSRITLTFLNVFFYDI